MKAVRLEVLHSPGCQICRAFDEFWGSISKEWPNVSYKKIELTTPEGQEMVQKYMVFSSPAIVFNGELFQMGGFDREKFVAKLEELSES